jgi:translation initiation factor IF-1
VTKEQTTIELVGEVVQVLAGSNFKVKLPDGRMVLARPSWRMQKYRIGIVAGDRFFADDDRGVGDEH